MSAQDFRLRTIYGQIILGVSPATIQESNAYIRHFSPLEQSELDGGYSAFLDNALEKGLASDEDKLKELNTNGLWTDEDEKNLETKLLYIKGLKTAKKNLTLPSQVEDQNKTIVTEEAAAQEMMYNKAQVMGLTAELFAKKKINEMYIFSSIFKDKACTQPFFSEEDADYLDSQSMNKVAASFNKAMKEFNDDTLKKISIASFFQNSYNLCEDNIYHFYGKPIISLTFYQAELAGYGRFFKSIIHSDPKPPEDVLSDPDKMIDWYQLSKNAEKMMKANSTSNMAVMDATPKDLEQMSMGQEVVSLTKLTTDTGKTKLRGRELMKLLQ